MPDSSFHGCQFDPKRSWFLEKFKIKINQKVKDWRLTILIDRSCAGVAVSKLVAVRDGSSSDESLASLRPKVPKPRCSRLINPAGSLNPRTVHETGSPLGSPFIRRKFPPQQQVPAGIRNPDSSSSNNSPASSPQSCRIMWASRRNRKEDNGRKSPSPSILTVLQDRLYNSHNLSSGRSSSSNASPVSTLTGKSNRSCRICSNKFHCDPAGSVDC